MAPWFRRVLATLIDDIVVAIPTVALIVYVVFIRGTIHFTRPPTGTARSISCSLHSSGVTCGSTLTIHANMTALIAGSVIVYIVWSAYVVLAIAGRHGATVGMRVLKIKIVNANDFSTVSKGRSLVRYAVFLAFNAAGLPLHVSGLPLLLDELWPLWDKRNQTLHDKAARTVALDLR